jgi:prefoldin subunit 5
MKTDTTQSPEALAVIENQQDISKVNATIQVLEGAISKIEAQINEAHAAMPDTGPLISQREDLLAAIAIGENKSAELKKLDVQIEKLNTQRDGVKPGLDALKQTIDGLRRRLAEAQALLQKAEAKKEVLMRQLLVSMAEAVGAEYFSMAMQVSAQYDRLQALNYLIQNASMPTIFIGRNSLYIPRFRLESNPSSGYPAFLEDAIFTMAGKNHSHIQGLVHKEKAKFLEIGIEVA